MKSQEKIKISNKVREILQQYKEEGKLTEISNHKYAELNLRFSRELADFKKEVDFRQQDALK